MKVDVKKLIYPLFVKKGVGLKEEIPHLEGLYRMSPDVFLDEVKELEGLGIENILIFGIPEAKDPEGSEAYSEDNPVSIAVKLLKDNNINVKAFTDVCLCAYTSHGHCGITGTDGVEIDSEKTLRALSRVALRHAEAGADYVAPSAMAKGQVGAIRKALDENGFNKVKVMGYSAKFASNAYGPFRNIADSAPRSGDRSGYQLDHTDRETAFEKIKEDAAQGADIVMVKPALWYLDIIKEAGAIVELPLAVYNVSGEYHMIREGAKKELWDEQKMVEEIMNSFERAGADLIITYHAKDIANWAK